MSGYRVASPLLARYPPLDALTRELDRLIEYARVTELLARGKTAGEARGDIDAADVILLLGALSRLPSRSGTPGARTPGCCHRRRSAPSLTLP